MIRHAHAIEARVPASGDELGHAGYGQPYWDTKINLHAMFTRSFLVGGSCALRPRSAAAASIANPDPLDCPLGLACISHPRLSERGC